MIRGQQLELRIVVVTERDEAPVPQAPLRSRLGESLLVGSGRWCARPPPTVQGCDGDGCAQEVECLRQHWVHGAIWRGTICPHRGF